MTEERLLHWCEVCGRQELLTSEEGFQGGWDFPAKLGYFGVISPRTCPSMDCDITKTAWWALVVEHTPGSQLTERHKRTVLRIIGEPAPDP